MLDRKARTTSKGSPVNDIPNPVYDLSQMPVFAWFSGQGSPRKH